MSDGAANLWGWRFHSQDQLRAALEEYSEFHDDAKVARYGDAGGGSEGSDGKRMRVMKQNSAIDRMMEPLESWVPRAYRLLDMYFRRGLCGEHDGWAAVAKTCGLGHDRTGRWDHDAFDSQITWSVWWLWHVRKGRPERKS